MHKHNMHRKILKLDCDFGSWVWIGKNWKQRERGLTRSTGEDGNGSEALMEIGIEEENWFEA